MMSVTAVSIITTPNMMRPVSCSPNTTTPQNKAVTGSSAPKMAVGVEPIRWMASVIVTNEMMVGNKANDTALAHSQGDGTACRSVQKCRRTMKSDEPNKRQ